MKDNLFQLLVILIILFGGQFLKFFLESLSKKGTLMKKQDSEPEPYETVEEEKSITPQPPQTEINNNQEDIFTGSKRTILPVPDLFEMPEIRKMNTDDIYFTDNLLSDNAKTTGLSDPEADMISSASASIKTVEEIDSETVSFKFEDPAMLYRIFLFKELLDRPLSLRKKQIF